MCSNKRGSWAIYRKQQPIRNKPCGSLCVALHGSGHMRGGTSSSTCPSAWPAHMQGDTMPSTCLDAWPGSMQGDITSSTCLAAWPGRMHRDTSCLAVPPRASMCHSACCDHLYYNTSCFPFHTHTARSLPPRPEHAHQATSSFLVNSADFAFPSFYRRRLSGSSRRFLLRHVRVDDSFRVDGISSTGIHEVLYSHHFAPWRIVPWFYHLQPRDGAPLVEEPRRGIRSNSSFENNWSSRYVFMKIQEPFHYPTFWRTVGESRFLHFFPLVVNLLIVGFVFRCILSGIFSWGSGGEEDVDDFSALSWGAIFDEQGGNIVRLPASVLYDEYQQAGTQRRRPFYAPPPRLTKMAPLDMGAGPFPYGNMIGDVPLAGIQQWLLNELFSLRNRVSDMAAQRDLLIQQVRASSRWELMKEWLERRREHLDPSEEYRQYLFWSAEPTRRRALPMLPCESVLSLLRSLGF
ncbi:hypothetical protein F2Q68_00033613 [Brassica cretica]|uniref:Transmembrane protein n=1 Tax=Brassica cretica TaxID=69181 RepID=A0A8S9H625_BRACR|nr:hypothetical protein F2Q68_00033613 [Brassica cretica]